MAPKNVKDAYDRMHEYFKYGVEVLTIGYGGKRPHAFFDELMKLNADLVVDVRRNPYKAFLGVYTFSSLMKRVENYVSIPLLGNALKTLPPKLVDEEKGMQVLMNIMKAYRCKRLVLLCVEKDEDRCHRKYVKEKLLERLRKS